MKEPQDILREITANIKGVPPEEIKFKDLRARRRKRKKKQKNSESENGSGRISNKEGFSISVSETEFCDYREIGKKRNLRKKRCLEEWGAYDFFWFANRLYIEKFGRQWDLKVGGNSLIINRVRDKFYDLFGFCCNLIMRDYIVFFFDNYINEFIRGQGEFYFSQMSQDWVISLFRDQYNFVQRFEEYIKKEKKGQKEKGEVTKEGVREAFQMGDTTLLGNYGIVIAFNWFLTIKRLGREDAAKLVIDACQDMYERDLIGLVVQSTELYSPYPSNLPFTQPNKLISRLDKSIKLNVEFNDNEKMQFLTKRV